MQYSTWNGCLAANYRYSECVMRCMLTSLKREIKTSLHTQPGSSLPRFQELQTYSAQIRVKATCEGISNVSRVKIVIHSLAIGIIGNNHLYLSSFAPLFNSSVTTIYPDLTNSLLVALPTLSDMIFHTKSSIFEIAL